MRISEITIAIAAICSACLLQAPACADDIANGIRKRDVMYSAEKPDKATYGTGIASRATEASVLRLEAEHDLQSGKIHDAVRKARKAAQFDPEVSDSHLILARALSACVKADGFRDKELYKECIAEWRLIRWHASNTSSESEAGRALASLRIARVMSKVKPAKDKSLPI